MLLYQGVRSLELFIDKDLPVKIIETMRKALMDEISKQRSENRGQKNLTSE
jgi:hypothetical protein